MRLSHSIIFITVGIVIAIIIAIIITLIVMNKNNNDNDKDKDNDHNNTGHVPSGSSKYLKAYVEDCQQSESLNYNMKELLSLDLIGFDFSLNCYDSVYNNIGKLIESNYKGKIFIHPDQTSSSKTCGEPNTHLEDTSGYSSIVKNCITTMKNTLGKNFGRVDGIIWEKEANKFMNECEATHICVDLFKKNDLQFAGWTTNFNFIPKPANNTWNYIFYEYYNIYTPSCINESKHPKNTHGLNEKCFVDYNPGCPKCFHGATCGPNSMKCDNAGQENTVYCSDLTPEERGKWMANVLIENKGGSLTPVIEPEKKIIYFTFTNISSPSFLKTLPTAADFDRFVGSFIDTIKEAGGHGIDKCKIGAWGCPLWIAESTPTFCV